MYSSKVSIVNSQNWDNFSVMRNSKAANFIPIPCPTHSNYSITNICKAPGCIQPLCPECITAHVQLHQKTKKPSKIQNIINTRINCIDKLSQILQQLNGEIQKFQNSCGVNLQNFIQKNRKKLQFAKSKIQNFVAKYFQELQQKFQLLQLAYINQRQKKNKQMKVKITPLVTHIQQINQYKTQLESQDYIPALIQLLNDPPKKPQTLSKLQFQQFGQVKMNQQAFQSLKISVQSFINIKSFLPQQNKFAQQINTNSSRFSNQMKFSKIGRSSSRQLIESKLQQSRQLGNSRSNSRKKIFSKEKNVNGTSQSRINVSTVNRPLQQGNKENSKLKIIFDSKEQKSTLIDHIYFKYDKGILAYFPPSQKYFFAVQTICAQSGFDRFQFSQKFTVPLDHQVIITPDCRIFLIGGSVEGNLIANHNEILLKIFSKTSSNTSIKSLSPMKQTRSKFSAVYFNDYIYVFGGLKGKQILSSAQRYSIRNDTWQKIRNMPQGLFSLNTCVFNDKIFKFGGILQTGQILNRIDVYYPETNQWQSIPSQVAFFLKMGSCQINSHQIMLFGGQTQFNTKKNQCYIITQQKDNQYKFSPCSSTMYDQSSFENSYVYRNSILAIQNNGEKNKVLMQFQGNKWRFLSC